MTLVSDTPTQDVVPGTGWSFSVTLQNVGNVTEIVHPTAAIPTGLDLPGGFFFACMTSRSPPASP